MRIHSRATTATRLLAACALAMSLAACSGSSTSSDASPDARQAERSSRAALDPIYAEPKVGDLYAAELTHFSAYEFGAGDTAYGMMRVVEVNDDRIAVYTETGAWPESRGAVQELRGNLEGIEWHEEEKIQIPRSELGQLVADGKILDARRD